VNKTEVKETEEEEEKKNWNQGTKKVDKTL